MFCERSIFERNSQLDSGLLDSGQFNYFCNPYYGTVATVIIIKKFGVQFLQVLSFHQIFQVRLVSFIEAA
jgi:hypothetical protein